MIPIPEINLDKSFLKLDIERLRKKGALSLGNGQKLRFIDPSFKTARNDLTPQFLRSQVAQGLVVITIKRFDGTIDVIATKDIAQKIKTGSIVISGKDEKAKAIGVIQIVSLEELQTALQMLTPKVQAVFDTTLSPSSATELKIENKGLIATLVGKLKSAFTSAFGLEQAEQRVIEETQHIKERIQKKQKEADEKEQEIVRHEVNRYEQKRSNRRQEERLRNSKQ